MPLNLYYSLKLKGDYTLARNILETLRHAAMDLEFMEVGELREIQGIKYASLQMIADDAMRRQQVQALHYLSRQMSDGSRNREMQIVTPKRCFAFFARSGPGCSRTVLGLARYPSALYHQGKLKKTNLTGWVWTSYCSTHYANDPEQGGRDSMISCHQHFVALLDEAKKIGCLRWGHDSTNYWKCRNTLGFY